jgi:hypothetical protein
VRTRQGEGEVLALYLALFLFVCLYVLCFKCFVIVLVMNGVDRRYHQLYL